MAVNAPIRIDFLCADNAGRSQMAAAFAEREAIRRGLLTEVEIRSGSPRPADAVHSTVVDRMAESGLDIAGAEPSELVAEDVSESEYVVTMGCSLPGVTVPAHGAQARSWNVRDPDGHPPETVRQIRGRIRRHVRTLFDDISRTLSERSAGRSRRGRDVSRAENAL